MHGSEAMSLHNEVPAGVDIAGEPRDATLSPGCKRERTDAAAQTLPITLALFALAFLVPAWPWLSGAVTIPWDAKSQFYPQVQFLARSIAHGEWPWWSPNVFAGW